MFVYFNSENFRGAFLAMALCFVFASALSGQDKTKDDAQSNDNEITDASFVEVTVLDSEGKHIPDAGILVGCWFQDQQYRNKYERNLKTDDKGVAKIKLLPTLERIRFWVSAKDHVTLFSGFEPGMLPNLPKKITFRLQKSESIGGKVVDSDGNPVAGATLEIKRDAGGIKTDTNDFSRLNTWIAEGEDVVKTNTDGEWMIDQRIPTGEDLELSFVVKHPNFLGDERWTSMEKKNISLKELKDRTATFELAKGVIVSGSVLDDAGHPVKDALVIWGDGPYFQHGSQESKTNELGEFRIPAQKPVPLNFTIVAKGWMPQLRKLDLSKELKPQEFKLTKGKKLHLRFVDSKGHPVPNVNVSLNKWRGIESLYNMKHSNVKDSQIPRVSDENGEYIWDWAPDDEIECTIGNREFARMTIRKLTADP